MNPPLISILIPCYNVAPYIQECIDSIVSQTYTNLQIVLIDDGSKDETWEILKKNAEIDSRIEIYSQPNQGVASTRNNLLEKVKGEFILFVDGDDWIEKDTIQFLVGKARGEDLDAVFYSMAEANIESWEAYQESVLNKDAAIKEFLAHDKIRGSLWNKLFKAKIAGSIRFDSSISYGEDALFCWEYLLKSKKILNTNKRLYHYRLNPDSISHQTFGAKKLTGYKAWEKITKDASVYCPEFTSIACATWGKESYYLLMQAGAGGYKYDENIMNLQKCVKENFHHMIQAGKLRGREYINARLVKTWYGYASLYYRLFNLKSRLTR